MLLKLPAVVVGRLALFPLFIAIPLYFPSTSSMGLLSLGTYENALQIIKSRAEDEGQLGEGVPSMPKALTSIPSTL